ncbi:MAG: polymerase subunit sigma-24 [Caulobacteraceae bacterium]|nr:polymerase subunit sigma-24 [Caulobacteraceae bacterium]
MHDRQTEAEVVEALAREHRPALLRYFRRRGFYPPDDEDAAQEVFVRLINYFSEDEVSATKIERLDRYLFASAANVATDLRRKGAARAGGRHEVYDETLHAQLDVDPEAILSGRQSLDTLILALNELPERTRTIFALIRFEQVKQAEVARRLGVTLRCVEKHLQKALAHLGERIGRGR